MAEEQRRVRQRIDGYDVTPFATGPRRRGRTNRIHARTDDGPTPISSELPDPSLIFAQNPWATRCETQPAPGHIRLLSDPESATSDHLKTWWWRDRTLTEWINDIDQTHKDMTDNPFARAVYQLTYAEDVAALFYATQRQRWLARIVVRRLRDRVWSKRPVCNVDLIDLQPVADRDAISITDTTNRCIYRFHRRDLLHTVLSNLTLSDEFMPTPRYPTNPWTNAPFTKAQAIAVCHRLAADFVQRGRCPPVLLSTFWDAKFNIRRFATQNAAILSQYAIQNYFGELTDDNFQTVYDTMTGLLSDAGVDFSPLAVSRWLRATPRTPTHQTWVTFCRDYTLYMNLHIQVRPQWHDTIHIYQDVRALYRTTRLVDVPPSTRIRVIRGQPTVHPIPPPPVLEPLLSLQTTLFTTTETTSGLQGLLNLMMPLPPLDVSGNETMTFDMAIQLIQNSLFR